MATFDNTPADPNTANTDAFSNTGASANASNSDAFANDDADPNTANADAFSNDAASANAANADAFSNTGATANSGNTESFDGFAASANASNSDAFSNDDADANTANTDAFSNSEADPNTANADAFSNDAASAKVYDGEVSPVDGGTDMSILTTVAHTFTLVSGTNYAVNCGSRAAAIEVDLPDPPSANQIIEVRDASRQAASFKISVDPGTKTIGGNSGKYEITVAGGILEIAYDSTLQDWIIT